MAAQGQRPCSERSDGKPPRHSDVRAVEASQSAHTGVTPYRSAPLPWRQRKGGAETLSLSVPLFRFYLACAYGTAAVLRTRTGIDGCLPDMAFAALPPYLTLCPGHHIRGTECAVFGGMPLSGEFRVYRRKIVYAGNEQTSGTDGATGSQSAGLDGRLPTVAFFASPPDLLMAAIGDVIRRQHPIILTIPLGQQLIGGGRSGRPPPSGYFTMFSQKRMRMVATSARVALFAGARCVSSTPRTRPVPIAQLIASFA